MKYRITIALGGTRSQAIAKTALATSDALDMDLSKPDPSVDMPLNNCCFRPAGLDDDGPFAGSGARLPALRPVFCNSLLGIHATDWPQFDFPTISKRFRHPDFDSLESSGRDFR
jgi:hypothetical protein